MTAMEQPNGDLLWAAVDRLTKPTKRIVHRDDNPEARDSLADALLDQDSKDKLIPAQMAQYTQMGRTQATVPSLWDQSTDALTTGSEAQEGRAQEVHRSPCDIDLMEIRALIRETVDHELRSRRVKPRDTVPAQIRQLASVILSQEPDQLWWFEYRMSAWARLLSVYLQEVINSKPKSVRIRVACPDCNARTALIEDEYGIMVNVPPILIDFSSDGLVRAAECTACGELLAWRGEEMWALAARLGIHSGESLA